MAGCSLILVENDADSMGAKLSIFALIVGERSERGYDANDFLPELLANC